MCIYKCMSIYICSLLLSRIIIRYITTITNTDSLKALELPTSAKIPPLTLTSRYAVPLRLQIREVLHVFSHGLNL